MERQIEARGPGVGGGGALYFYAKLQPSGQKFFSKLRPRLILGTGLVDTQLLKDLNPPLLLPAFLSCKGCIAIKYLFCVYFIYFTLLAASIIKRLSNLIHCPFSSNLVSQFCSGQC